MSTMNRMRVRIENETYLSLESISDCYQCNAAWIREAYEFGLLGVGRRYEGHVVLHVKVLDRVAQVVRLGRYEGLGFEAIVVLLGTIETEPAQGGYLER